MGSRKVWVIIHSLPFRNSANELFDFFSARGDLELLKLIFEAAEVAKGHAAASAILNVPTVKGQTPLMRASAFG